LDIQTLRNETKNILNETLQYSRSRRYSDALSDIDWLETHVMRVLGKYSSGREYLQSLENDDNEKTLVWVVTIEATYQAFA
jgi:hypothetical protein